MMHAHFAANKTTVVQPLRPSLEANSRVRHGFSDNVS